MNFNLTEEQHMLQELVREFAWNEIEPRSRELEEKHEFPHVLLKKLSELGILGMGVESEFSGTYSDHLSIYLAIEEISRVFPSLAVIVSVHWYIMLAYQNSFAKIGKYEKGSKFFHEICAISMI